MEREAVESLRRQMLEVLESYREHEDNMEVRERARRLYQEYLSWKPHLDEPTANGMEALDDIMTEGSDAPQQRIIDAIEEVRSAMHGEMA